MKRNTIFAWSHTRLERYHTCPHHAQLSYVLKVPELPRPDLGGEPPNERGTRLHDNCQNWVKRVPGTELEPEFKNWRTRLERLREIWDDGRLEVENMWCYGLNFAILPDDAKYWEIKGRVKIDFFARSYDGRSCCIIDVKSGKRKYNELSHGRQLDEYAVGALFRYPMIDNFDLELWYCDTGDFIRRSMNRDDIALLVPGVTKRINVMMEDTIFNPNPSQHNCRFCPYGPETSSNKWVDKNGACKHGV